MNQSRIHRDLARSLIYDKAGRSSEVASDLRRQIRLIEKTELPGPRDRVLMRKEQAVNKAIACAHLDAMEKS